ncbi:DUF421 domain-containing protein [Alkalibacillus almallahensis]|uniref:DUF421 domain-containing protein n=1 Tax=Alkalibacillus almallahensis TaxID=1379154 RepID=UPI0014220BA2|nr:DUF421 domain-containing protein [Alkalibacillus almallahensis]NIK11265.1 uncharacterized membrane protein YcaP (DUF421 family) [Alkalibacillus almallahensis]
MVEEIILLVIRTIGVYIAIYLLFRFMGKREIGELSVMDLVIFIMLAEIGILSIERTDDSFLVLLTPMLVLFVIQRVTAWLSLKNHRVRSLLDGQPSIIIRHGKIDEEVMKKQRYNLDDLMVQLREKGAVNLKEVELAILETSGKLSVFTRDDQPLNYFEPVILDGKWQEKALDQHQVTKEDILKQLKHHGIEQIDKISFAQIQQDGSIHIDLQSVD